MKDRNGKPIIGHNGKALEMTEGALEQHRAERTQKIQQHLVEMNNVLTVENSAINAVVLAAIQRDGLPPLEQHDAFLANAGVLAKRISERQLERKWTVVKSILKDLNVHDIQQSVVFGAKLCGVELFDAQLEQPPAEEAKTEAPKLVTH